LREEKRGRVGDEKERGKWDEPLDFRASMRAPM